MSYSAQRDIARNTDFQAKLVIAACKTALDIYSENPATAGHAARALYATALLNAPTAKIEAIAYAAVADDATTTNTSDANLLIRMSSIWNALAGA